MSYLNLGAISLLLILTCIDVPQLEGLQKYGTLFCIWWFISLLIVLNDVSKNHGSEH